MKEDLTKAMQDIGFIGESLRNALHKSNAVEGIVVMELIKRAAELKNDIGAFLSAHETDSPSQ